MKKKKHQDEAEPEATSHSDAEDQATTCAQCVRLEAQLKRTMADLQNIRKRHVKELEAARLRTLEAFAGELLPVLDNFHLALAAHEEHESPENRADTDSMIEGLRMVRSLLEGVLERHGLSEISAHGELFDPNVHEAVGVDPDADVGSGKVSRVVQRGYAFADRVLRPTKVHVSGETDQGRRPNGGEDTEE